MTYYRRLHLSTFQNVHVQLPRNSWKKRVPPRVYIGFDMECLEYQKLPAVVASLRAEDPEGGYILSTNRGVFKRIFICPSSSKTFFQNCVPFFAVDGASAGYLLPMVLLTAVAKDGNNKVSTINSVDVASFCDCAG